jgi:hypothetical protein
VLSFRCQRKISRVRRRSVTGESGPRLPTWALQQVGSYLGHTGYQINMVVTAARDPKLSFVALFT